MSEYKLNKYIIKNCPFLSTAEYPNGNVETDLCGCAILEYCQDNDNCLLKQIVDKCKKAQKTQWVNNKKKPYSPSKAAFAREILNLLEIEEVDEEQESEEE